jgi:predicted nucleic acid-binding protein
LVSSPSYSLDVYVRDPKDIPVLAAALECEADILITGDNDLLVLGTAKNMRIMKPRDFLDLFVSGYH